MALAVLVLMAPSGAFAQSGRSGSDPGATRQPSSAPQIPADGGGSGGGAKGATVGGLPFTALDLAVLAITAATLLGAGIALGRLSDPARRSPSERGAGRPGKRTIVPGERNA